MGTRSTYEDWLQYPDDGRLYELIDGELYASPPPAIRHQRISRDLGIALHRFLAANDRGEMLHAPTGVRLGDERVLEPDLVIVLAEHAHRISDQVIDGAPDLVVEVLSPGTARRDLSLKRSVYEDAQVPEYWIVDPESQSIEVLRIVDGAYVRGGLFRRKDTLTSALLPGLEIVLGEVFPQR